MKFSVNVSLTKFFLNLLSSLCNPFTLEIDGGFCLFLRKLIGVRPLQFQKIDIPLELHPLEAPQQHKNLSQRFHSSCSIHLWDIIRNENYYLSESSYTRPFWIIMFKFSLVVRAVREYPSTFNNLSFIPRADKLNWMLEYSDTRAVYFHLSISKSIGSFSVLFTVSPFARIDIFIWESVKSFPVSFSPLKLTYSKLSKSLRCIQYHNNLLYPCKTAFQFLLWRYFSNLLRKHLHFYMCIFHFRVWSFFVRHY